jgi:DNA repair protein RadD
VTLFSDLPPQPVPDLAVTLRPYQVEAVDATFAWMNEHSGHPLIVVPTGGGKSLIQTAIIHAVLREYPRDRILCLTHVRELIQQNHDATLRAWPGAPVGICSAGIGRREWDAQVLFAGIQTVYRKAAKLQWADVIVVDEAHLLPKEGEGMYRTLINAMLGMNPKLRIIGLTATPYRTDSGLLHKGKDALFTDIAYTCDIVKLIEDGYLSPIISKGTGHQIDTTAVQKRGGEFIANQLQAAATRGDLVAQSVAEIVQRGADRKAWLLFACGIKHAEQIAEALRSHGIDCETIFGDTPDEQRDRIITRYKNRQLRAIVNVGVLTTGFDAPHVDLIALLRPTCSPGLYVQMVGRGLRRAEGKLNTLVLDYGENVERHGPIDCVQPTDDEESEGDGTPPVKKCPQCASYVHAAITICPDCGFVFPPREITHKPVASNAPIISAQSSRPTIERWDVIDVHYMEHRKPGKPVSLRVEYIGTGFHQRANEWVCFEHEGFARRKAESWWQKRGGRMPAPPTVDLALVRIECGELPPVASIVLDTRGKYPEVKGCVLGKHEAGDESNVKSASLPDPAESAVDYGDIPF